MSRPEPGIAPPAGPAGVPAILRYGDPRLRRVCRAPEPDEDTGPLVARLWRVLDHDGGVGLAAPQLGDLRRVIVCRLPADRGGERVTLVDPVIEAHHGFRVAFSEGCLSFPGLFVNVGRPEAVTVRYRDADGRTHRRRAGGLLARIVQHEVDHLDGVLFIDRVPAWRRCWLAWRLHRIRRGREIA